MKRLADRLLWWLRRHGLASRTWRLVDGRRVYGWRVGPAGWFQQSAKRAKNDPNQQKLFEEVP